MLLVCSASGDDPVVPDITVTRKDQEPMRPDLLETVHCGVKVDTDCELCVGRTNADRWGRVQWEPNAHVAVEIDAEGFLDLLTQRLISLG